MVYGYLKADVKRLVDQIVDELAKDSAAFAPPCGDSHPCIGRIAKTFRLMYFIPFYMHFVPCIPK